MIPAALFDLDGTLIPNTSAERLLLRYLLKRKEIGFVNLGRALRSLLFHIGSWEQMVYMNKYYLTGLTDAHLKKIIQHYFSQRINILIPQAMRDIITSHRQNDTTMILLSGTLSCILEVFAETLLFDDYRGTDLKVEGGILTGNISGLHPYGLQKVTILDQLQKKHNFDLKHSFFYANHFSDRFAMEKVGHPVALNPDKRLRRYAEAKVWDILDIG